jgi:hypothetical protein
MTMIGIPRTMLRLWIEHIVWARLSRLPFIDSLREYPFSPLPLPLHYFLLYRSDLPISHFVPIAWSCRTGEVELTISRGTIEERIVKLARAKKDVGLLLTYLRRSIGLMPRSKI